MNSELIFIEEVAGYCGVFRGAATGTPLFYRFAKDFML
jgi:hypothetical protein